MARLFLTAGEPGDSVLQDMNLPGTGPARSAVWPDGLCRPLCSGTLLEPGFLLRDSEGPFSGLESRTDLGQARIGIGFGGGTKMAFGRLDNRFGHDI